jgi:hypothetical protein
MLQMRIQIKHKLWHLLGTRECIQFHKFHMTILLGNFNVEVGREDIFEPTNGMKSLHEISNNNNGCD